MVIYSIDIGINESFPTLKF